MATPFAHPAAHAPSPHRSALLPPAMGLITLAAGVITILVGIALANPRGSSTAVAVETDRLAVAAGVALRGAGRSRGTRGESAIPVSEPRRWGQRNVRAETAAAQQRSHRIGAPSTPTTGLPCGAADTARSDDRIASALFGPTGERGNAPVPIETPGSRSVLDVPEGHRHCTVSRLAVPPGARWQARLSAGSLHLAIETGALRVSVIGGTAHVTRSFAPLPLPESSSTLAAGIETLLWSSDRLVVHGNATVTVHGACDLTAVATVTQIGESSTGTHSPVGDGRSDGGSWRINGVADELAMGSC